MITCNDALRHLWDYLFDEIDPGNRYRIAEHLDACRRCCGEVAFLGELRRFVSAARPGLPADVGVRMEAFLAALDRSRRVSGLGGSRPEGSDDRPDVQG